MKAIFNHGCTRMHTDQKQQVAGRAGSPLPAATLAATEDVHPAGAGRPTFHALFISVFIRVRPWLDSHAWVLSSRDRAYSSQTS